MENENSPQNTTEEKISPTSRIMLVFNSPAKAFQNLNSYLDWLIPLIIIIVFAIGRSFLMQDMEIEMVKDKIAKNEQIPEQQKTEILNRMDQDSQGGMQMVKTIGGIIIMTFVFTFIVAGLYLFTGNVILGGSANMTQLMSVYALGSLVFIPEHIVKVAMAFAKGSPKVYTSLAILFDAEQSQTLLFNLANAIDVFSIWKLALWAIGFGVVYKFNQTKSWIAVGSWYIIGILILYGLNLITGGMLG